MKRLALLLPLLALAAAPALGDDTATNAPANAPFTITDAIERAKEHEAPFSLHPGSPDLSFRSIEKGTDDAGVFWSLRYAALRYKPSRAGSRTDVALRVRPSGTVEEIPAFGDSDDRRFWLDGLFQFCEASGIDLSAVSGFKGTPPVVDTNVVEEVVDGETVRMLSLTVGGKPSEDDPLGVVVWTNASVRVTYRLLFEARTNRFARLAAQADRIVVRDGGYTCHSKNVDEQPVLATITNAAEIAVFNESFRFKPQPPGLGNCACCGYPGIDWWTGDRKIILSNVQHCHALRWSGFGGDMPLVDESAAKLKGWLTDHGVKIR